MANPKGSAIETGRPVATSCSQATLVQKKKNQKNTKNKNKTKNLLRLASLISHSGPYERIGMRASAPAKAWDGSAFP